MTRGRRASVGLLILLTAVAAACGTTSPVGAVEVTLDNGTQVASWGEGEYGVVLIADDGETVADWAPLATEMAANRMMVVALEPSQADPNGLAAAARWLTDAGAQRVAYLASGSAGGTRLVETAGEGAAIDQLILVSGSLDGDGLSTLGEPPKLFIAAEDHEAGSVEAERMTDAAAGAWNAVLLVPGSERGAAILDSEGSDALVEGVVARLEERR
jgi:hypothetical protein